MKVDTVMPYSLLSDEDIYLFKEGKHYRLYEKLGAHPTRVKSKEGTQFAVWAPNAQKVTVSGEFNGWNVSSHPLYPRQDSSGIWEGFIPGAHHGMLYKYSIETKNGDTLEKGDPFAFYWEAPPKTASIIWDLSYEWKDQNFQKRCAEKNAMDKPQAIYEVHLGSWQHHKERGLSLNYRELADTLMHYVKEMGFTHIELMPVMEHPFYGSWGYQTVGYFAPTSRFGTPQDFMYMIDTFHKEDIAVILDWVPSHFPNDPYGLSQFDGTYLFEHSDPKLGFHPDWSSCIFNYGRYEVRSFLISSALFFCDKYHIDGLRVDAVASMLYLDYSRKEGQWIPNKYGGNENLEAIDFLKELNQTLYKNFPYIQTFAEESTAWPMVSRPTYLGGLGFGYKWNMGWMHDTLEYFQKDPVYRKFHHNQLLFSLVYAFSENFVLPLSHDEVVYGKRSLLEKMPGDEWQKFANLRLLFGYMYAHPGKKLLFNGGEFGQFEEWNHDVELNWDLLKKPYHQGLQKWVCDLNKLYRSEKALYERDVSNDGFEWVDLSDSENSVISFLRKGNAPKDRILVVCNFTSVLRENYKIGIDQKGVYKEILNSDSHYYGGSDKGNFGSVETSPFSYHGKKYMLSLTLPPLAILILTQVSTNLSEDW